MHNTHIILGSNLGERDVYLSKAIDLIDQQAGHIINKSAIYETSAWGKTDEPNYLNQCIEITTSMEPVALLNTLLNIEKELGRTRDKKWEARTIDIDLLFYDDLVMHTNELTLPHPHLHERKFVLTPLNEIASTLFHPVLKKNIFDLLFTCKDQLLVKKWK